MSSHSGGESVFLHSDSTVDAKRIITVCVEERTFGIEVGCVREIKGWQTTTLLPNAPAHVRGVLNLRGIIVAVYDLRARIGMGMTEATRAHVIVVVDVADRMVGLLVDSVSDIVDVPADSIRPPPDIESTGAGLLAGLALLEGAVVGLLDLPVVFDATVTLPEHINQHQAA